jgi:hypothetical protein
MRDDIHTVLWLFGRGLSLGCGLHWDDLPVPSGPPCAAPGLGHRAQLSRAEKTQWIREQLGAAMAAPGAVRR